MTLNVFLKVWTDNRLHLEYFAALVVDIGIKNDFLCIYREYFANDLCYVFILCLHVFP